MSQLERWSVVVPESEASQFWNEYATEYNAPAAHGVRVLTRDIAMSTSVPNVSIVPESDYRPPTAVIEVGSSPPVLKAVDLQLADACFNGGINDDSQIRAAQYGRAVLRGVSIAQYQLRQSEKRFIRDANSTDYFVGIVPLILTGNLVYSGLTFLAARSLDYNYQKITQKIKESFLIRDVINKVAKDDTDAFRSLVRSITFKPIEQPN